MAGPEDLFACTTRRIDDQQRILFRPTSAGALEIRRRPGSPMVHLQTNGIWGNHAGLPFDPYTLRWLAQTLIQVADMLGEESPLHDSSPEQVEALGHKIAAARES